MSQSTNVITIQQGMHKLYPYFVITKYHTPQARTHSIYIINRTNQEHENESSTRNEANQTKQEQIKKVLFKNNNL